MGWWSATVMGGDTPLDFEGDLYDVAGISYEDAHEDEMTKENEDLCHGKLSMLTRRKSMPIYEYKCEKCNENFL